MSHALALLVAAGASVGDALETVTVVHTGTGRTKQSMKKECDINNILARYKKTNLLEHVKQGVPSFVDVSEVGDYRSAIEHLRSTERFFGGLPASVRAAFRNDPAEFLDALDSTDGQAKLRELGVLPKLERAPEAPANEGSPAAPATPPAQ